MGASQGLSPAGAPSDMTYHIAYEYQHSGSEHKRARRGDEIEPVPAHAIAIGVDAARHAQQAGDMHREEAEIEADEHGPEIPLSQTLIHHFAGEFREPEIGRAHHRENVDSDQHVMQMRHHEIGVGQLPVHRHRAVM